MKKVRLVADCAIGGTDYKAGTVLELDAVAADALIAEGTAIAYTEADAEANAAQAHAQELDAALAQTESDKAQAGSDEPKVEKKKMNLFVKAFLTAVETKAATDYASTEATDVLGLIQRAPGVFGLVGKQSIAGNMKIVMLTDNATSDNLPDVELTAESTANAESLTVTAYDCIPGKWYATVAIPSEMIEDVPTLEARIGQLLGSQLNVNLDANILAGAFTSSIGCKGLTVDANAGDAEFADLDAPTRTELLAMVGKIDPGVVQNSTWVMSPAFWAACQDELMDSNNLSGQLIQVGAAPKMFGFPVIVSVSAPAASPVFFGDFSQYQVGVARQMKLVVDQSAAFLTDAVVVKVSGRYCGGLAAGAKVFNGTTVYSICKSSEVGAS